METYSEKDGNIPKMITKNLVDGMIVLGKIEREHVLQIKQENIPLVLCGHPIPGIELHSVMPDGRQGTYEITKHLISLGHKKIAVITGGPIFDPVSSDRLDGYRFAMFESKIKAPDEYITAGDFYEISCVKNAIDQLLSLKNPPTAIVCGCDSFAYETYFLLKQRGVKVPKQMSVAGFDDVPFPYYLDSVRPKLTTAHVNLEQLGSAAVEVLLDVIETPSKAAFRHTLPTKLIIGSTTGLEHRSTEHRSTEHRL
jgi:LacI family transcriptional regulator